MKENRIQIALKNGRSIGGQFRNPSFVLLEGIAPECVTSFDIEKAIANKDVKAMPGKTTVPAPAAEPAPVETPIAEPAAEPEQKPAPEPKPKAKKKLAAKNTKKKKNK